MKLTVSRRAFTKTFAGLGAGAYAQFTGLFRDTFVHAQDASSLRLIVLTQPHGRTLFWGPRAPGGGPAGETGWTLDFDPDSCLGPLEKHKDSLVVMEGLDIYCVYKPGSTGSIGHQGAIGVLTGNDLRSQNDRRARGPSIDTYVARLLKVDPLQLKYNQAGGSSWDANGESVVGFGENVGGAYTSLFGNLTTPSMTPDPTIAKTRAAQAQVLKFLRDDAGALRPRLAGPERIKLDLHLESLRLMEQKLDRPVSAGCQKPAAPASKTLDGQVEHQLGLQYIASALSCNLTRVATFHMSPGPYYPWLSLGAAKPYVHNDIVHMMKDSADDIMTRYVSRVHRWYASQVASLIDMLKAIPEGGKTVYDNTIILWTNELGNAAAHWTWNVPFVLAGGGGRWKKGRYLNFGTTGGARGEMAAHNGLLVSVANQFGANINTFGDTTFTGELRGL